jgi:hypothetical protein
MAKNENENNFIQMPLDAFEQVAETFFILMPKDGLFEERVNNLLVQKDQSEKLEDIKRFLSERARDIIGDPSAYPRTKTKDLTPYVRAKFDLKAAE